ncbi:MAG: hypothetical protein US83_C0019G0015 [Candidatus Falkowbacteria bacterium GW2011_GWC2_38_22]|uniref:Integral membrane protein CcmA involved in cell shape determination n=1 Tax=Candidatus Falkowbacteria bacterium GW2011_GWE1_38_31 TaxID=1618638 RepID=A0A0G0JRL3_9BACT|nr:MAG: hypothetical protein US73_C0017G0005 [Candidatus Falkowbacteria bacterium GW2011_GWF2_38_1205]KKQ60421.1 MAG: hypothetical protein US83_C0019G0015 [Candidatus Falkowbacteria bacterium GW2011_GWC2_38_22]KKQ62468.1 MAG: hypothetical protein US84_C0016G0015 [Candidatus Falkowbacteria bacterium GW2011_GWF1_38_22]KKQ64539.1 MAG: hypothetical protein US87_C0016G0015 [Candidatus Falkowbacteria bacterium GW2011_GWE2_38_254]KKQ69377.1 MAG: hypothetical protein US91_C0015G0015 [Candidatus Falkowb
MFNKETENINIKEAETVIGPSIKVKGNFHGQGNIIIEGQVEGSIKTNAFLLIGNKSIITASVEAKNAKVGGIITGNIKIDEYLEIGPSANIKGDIEVKSISINKGAIINGRIVMGAEKSAEK